MAGLDFSGVSSLVELASLVAKGHKCPLVILRPARLRQPRIDAPTEETGRAESLWVPSLWRGAPLQEV